MPRTGQLSLVQSGKIGNEEMRTVDLTTQEIKSSGLGVHGKIRLIEAPAMEILQKHWYGGG